MPNQNKLDSVKRNLDANILNVESLLRSKFGPDIIPESYDNVIVSNESAYQMGYLKALQYVRDMLAFLSL